MSNQSKLSAYRCPAITDFPDIELYMDQVIGVLEKHLLPFFEEEHPLTPTMINNYVKQKILPAPQNKKYTRAHLARLFMICILKGFMQLSDICILIENLEKESDPMRAYESFCCEMDAALGVVFAKKEPTAEGARKGWMAVLRSACMASAAILYSRTVFLAALPCEKEKGAAEKEKNKEKSKEKSKKK